jgi:general secretion pathway protein B
MSLIHEALKKAEAQRRLGEPPTLGTPVGGARKRRSLLPVLGALIAVALGAGWWLSSRQNAGDAAPVAQAPATAANPNPPAAGAPATEAPVSTAAERRPVSNPNAPVKSVGSSGPINQAPAQAPQNTVKEVAERESEPHPAGTNPLAPGEAAPLALGATPPQTTPNDPAGVAAKAATKQRQGTDVAAAPAPPAPAPAAQNLGKTTAAAPPTANANTTKPTAPPSMPPPAQPAAQPAAAVAPPAPSQPVAAAQPPAPSLENLPLYWQLPLNIRKDLPALKLSMHVYNEAPDKRFVILNGNRQKEGDDLGADVRLAEIRVDGAVLEFHGQRFLVPRGGS